MNTLQIWLLASRPKTLIATGSPVLIGSSLAFMNGRFSLPVFLSTLFGALFIQIGMNLANDYFDGIRGTDAYRIGPTRVTAAGLVSYKAMRRAIIVTFLSSALLSAHLILIGGLPIAILSLVAIFLGICYTGGPFPLAYLGIGDVFAFLFFGPVASLATYYLQTGELSLLACLGGIAPGCFSCALLTMNNLRDQKQDQINDKKTLVVRFGTQFGKKEYIACMLLPLACAFCFIKHFPLVVLVYFVLFPLIPVIQKVQSAFRPTDFSPLFPKTALLFAQYTFLFCAGVLLKCIL